MNQTPTFNFFLRDTAAKPGNLTNSEVEFEIRRDGELIAHHGLVGDRMQSAKPWWIAQELSLRSPDNGHYFPASHVLESGKYTVSLKINGKAYASYVYEAEDGKIPFKGRQDRSSADPLTYLEGAIDRF